MKNKIGLFAFLFLLWYSNLAAQFPHLSGTIKVSRTTGVITGDVQLSNLPHVEDYTIWLNSGLNIAYFRDSSDRFNYDYERIYEEKQSWESFQYYFPNNNNDGKFLPNSVRIQYTGAFPVVANYDRASDWGDWKGNIAFNHEALRASEQSVWYPILYDAKNDILYDKVTYDLTIIAEEGNSIYLNGAAPVKAPQQHFTSAFPVPLLLFVGNYDFVKQDQTYFVNGKLKPAQQQTLSDWTNKLIAFYESKLQIPYGSPVTYLSTNPVSVKPGWLFVTYPTIAIVGNDRWSLAGYFDEETNAIKDTINISLFAHELAHYYIGSRFVPNAELRWVFLEGMTEYIALQATQELVGQEAYEKMIDRYLKNIEKLEVLPLNTITESAQVNEVYRYAYVPLLLTALEKEIGEKKIWKWFRIMIGSDQVTTDFNYFRSSLLEAGVSEKDFEKFEIKYINAAEAKINVQKCLRKN